MSRPSVGDVRGYLASRYAEGLRLAGVDPAAVPDEFDLLTHGVVDSFGVLELISDLEARFGLEIDFGGLPVEEVGVFGPLCRYVAESGVPRGGPPTNAA